MSRDIWIELPSSARYREISSQQEALRNSYQIAGAIGHQLLCASIQACRAESPDVTACAAIVRDAVHKPEKERANAVKAAEADVLKRQVDYVSTMLYFEQHKEAWQAIRATLVSNLEALFATPEPNAAVHFSDVDLSLNCEAVVGLIDSSDISINDVNKRRYSQPTEKLAKAAFQKVFAALVAEVSDAHWDFAAGMACDPSNSTEILRDLPVDKISSTDVPAEFVACSALCAARDAFENAMAWPFTSNCRDFAQEVRGTVNEPQMAESLLAALPDVTELLRLESERDGKLRVYARKWRTMRSRVDALNVLFVKTAELLPAATAEAAAIEDEKMRLRVQNACLFAARRLKENLKFVRECNRFVPEREPNRHRPDIASAVARGHSALVDRIRSKQLQRPTTAVTPEPYF